MLNLLLNCSSSLPAPNLATIFSRVLQRPLIVLAEDDRDEAEIVLLAFDRAGVSAPAHVCLDGTQVLSYLKGESPFADRARYPFPDLLILDFNLPDMNALEVLQWIRTQPSCAALPVVVFTSFASSDKFKQLYRAGANACLSKPVDFLELQARIKGLHDFWSRCEFPARASAP